MSPAQALEQEMSELACNDPSGAVTATVTVGYNSTPLSKQATGVANSPGGFGSPRAFKKGYFNSAYEDSAAEATQNGRSASPAQPFVAQHNNLIAGGDGSNSAYSSRPGSGGSTSGSGGIGRLKDRM